MTVSTGEKIDLAHAYLDMDDPNGARGILNEILDDPDATTAERDSAAVAMDRVVAATRPRTKIKSLPERQAELQSIVDHFNIARQDLDTAKRAAQFAADTLKRALVQQGMTHCLSINVSRLRHI